jgi:hypothetical protein
MANLITFIPKKDLTARANLQAYILLAKNQILTWSEIEGFYWENSRWTTPHGTIRFVNYKNAFLHPSISPQKSQLMHSDFMDVVKAYLRYEHSRSAHKNIRREMQGLRALEFALIDSIGEPDITKLTQDHFNSAMNNIQHLAAAPSIATEILRFVKRMAAHRIVTSSAHHWSHPYVGVRSYRQTNGGQAPQEIKNKKLPNQDALLAIGAVFARGYSKLLDDNDVMVTSTTGLLLSAPMRIGETGRFRTDCIASDEDKNGKTQYYFQYWVPKIRQYARKPIPEVMAETAIEAVRRLKAITQDGRRLARYLESSPSKFYRHPKCPNVADDMVLTRDQVVEALGFAHKKSVEDFLKKHTGNMRLTGYTLNSLWEIVLAEHRVLNPHFPYQEASDDSTVQPLKMSESLFCFQRYQFSADKITSPVLLVSYNPDFYSKRLDASIKKNCRNQRPMCFFQKHGFESIKMKSHSIRHMLNRLAEQSGLTIDVITAWSSRSSVQQTQTYLDNDQGEIAADIASAMKMSREQVIKAPVTSSEAEAYADGPIHRSRYGLCMRSWRIGPCNKFADCLNCTELIMCKGDKIAAKIISEDRGNLLKTYSAAQLAVNTGEKSATRWMKIARDQINRIDELLQVFENPNIDDASPISLTGQDFCHEQVYLDKKADDAGIVFLDRKQLSIEYGSDLLACLDDLRTTKNA